MSVNVFIAMQTQWRVGPNGRTGLDYGVLPAVMRMCGVPRKQWDGVFADIQTLEDAALSQMRSN